MMIAVLLSLFTSEYISYRQSVYDLYGILHRDFDLLLYSPTWMKPNRVERLH